MALPENLRTIDEIIRWTALGDLNNDASKIFNVFGCNGDNDSNIQEDVWAQGGTRVYLSTAQTMDISSADATDTIAGVGAQTVTVSGLDANYDFLNETINMNGLSTVTTTGLFLRVNSLDVTTSGATGPNVGKITCQSTGTADIQATISSGLGVPQLAAYSIPAGYRGLITEITFSAFRRSGGAGTKSGEFDIFEQHPGITGFKRREALGLANTGTGSFQLIHTAGLRFEEKTDIRFAFTAENNATAVTVLFPLLLVKL